MFFSLVIILHVVLLKGASACTGTFGKVHTVVPFSVVNVLLDAFPSALITKPVANIDASFPK
jgi:hypothetical protein